MFTHRLARGYIEHVAGEDERAVEALREGWDGLGALGERGIRSTIGGVLGEMLARLGRLDEAEAILDDAIALSTPDDWVTVEAVMMGRAFVASGRGDHDLACELAREAMELVDDLPRLAHLLVVSVERQLVAAQPDRAAETVAQRVEHALPHHRQLSRDRIGNIENFLHLISV